MSSTTLKTILEDFVKEYDLGKVGTTTATGSTTTLVDATRLKRPASGAEFNRNSPVRITSRAAVGGGNVTIGSNSFVDDYDPATGTVTVSPAFDDTAEIGANFIVFYPGLFDHSDRLVEAINRFLQRVAERRMRVPFTFVPNGDYLASLVATGWTVVSGATIAYSEQAHPDGWYPRLMKLTGSATGKAVVSTTLKANATEVWNIATTIHVGGADTASLVVYDETNSAAITVTWSKGTGSTTSLSPVEQIGTFTIPSGCTQISFRPTVAANGDVGYFGPVIAAPQKATLYTGQTWLEYLKRVEGLWTFDAGTYGPVERRWQPVDMGRHDDQLGWGQGFSFQGAPSFPLFADVLLAYPALTAGDPTAAASGSAASESDTTACPEPLVLAGTAVEVYQYLHERDAQSVMARGRVVVTSKWLGHLNRATSQLVTFQSDFNAPRKISVRKHFAGAASA